MTITVHHLNDSRSQRILWLLSELGVEYQVKRYQRDQETMLAPASLREVHPLGKSPVITDGELTLAESGAIVEYLVERYGNGCLAPATGTPERLRYTYWLHYAEGSAMPLLVMQLIFNQIEPKTPFFLRPIAKVITGNVKQTYIKPQIAQHLNYLEAELAKNTWFVSNEFTAADIQLSFPLEAAAAYGNLDASHPQLKAFLERIHARPAYQQALEQGGAYSFS
ncbi:MAG: glutathione S-transferase [Pleurocapsa sp.]